MKKLNVTAIILLYISFLFVGSQNINSQTTIESTMAGGLWSEGDTWVGGSEPTAIDNVVIKGPVFLDLTTSCEELTIAVGGALRNSGPSRILTINGDVTNEGIITFQSFVFTLEIQGNIENSGIWSNSHTNLIGLLPQNIQSYTPFTGSFFTSNKPSGHISADIPLRFNGVGVDLNGTSLFMTNGMDSIYLEFGYLTETTIIAQSLPKKLYCYQNSPGYFDNLSINADEIVLDGGFTFSNYFEIFGDTRVEGTFSNRQLNFQTATLNGHIVNNGTILDITYGWTMNVTGDITQNGIWTNFNTFLSGTGNQYLTFNSPFEGDNLMKTNPDGIVIANTNANFRNCSIDLDYDTLMIANSADSLILDGGKMEKSVIITDANETSSTLQIQSDNSAYFTDVEIVETTIDLSGTFEFRTPVTFHGDVVINGTLDNQSTTLEAYILEDITTDGTIQDISTSVK
jgi:hypothetical protein